MWFKSSLCALLVVLAYHCYAAPGDKTTVGPFDGFANMSGMGGVAKASKPADTWYVVGATVNSRTKTLTIPPVTTTSIGAVPYTGATGDVTLGSHNITAGTVTAAVTGTASGNVAKADYSAKGNILIGTGSGTYTALGVGTDGYMVTADSTQTSGVKWAAGGGSLSAPAAYLAELEHDSISGVTYSSGNITVITHTSGRKENISYSSGNISTIVYTDTDGTTTLYTKTFAYNSDNTLSTVTWS